MSREVKFRAWHKRYREMVPVQGIEYDKEEEEQRVQHPDYPVAGCIIGGSLGNYELMQYTGLKDKDGVEICEGDVVRLGTVYYYQVKWLPSGRFLLVPADGISSRSVVVGRATANGAVIGNIYENPELLAP